MFSIPLHEVQALIPPEADVIAHRRSLPLFGDGLVEAIPDEVLIGLEDPDDTNDGRASTLREAIETHGREALKSRLLFVRLPEQEKRALVAFLGSL